MLIVPSPHWTTLGGGNKRQEKEGAAKGAVVSQRKQVLTAIGDVDGATGTGERSAAAGGATSNGGRKVRACGAVDLHRRWPSVEGDDGPGAGEEGRHWRSGEEGDTHGSPPSHIDERSG